MTVLACALAREGSELVADLVSPTRCVACDVRLPPRTLFCPGCVVSVMRATNEPQHHERAAFSYGGAVAEAIHKMKYGGRADLAWRLGTVLATCARGLPADVVVSVPMHPQRLASRGFDQAALLSQPVATALGVPWSPRALLRVRDTARQASMKRDGRASNVASAFHTRLAEDVAMRHVLLVDDVRTTGATLSACTAALHEAGARTVTTLVLARRDWT